MRQNILNDAFTSPEPEILPGIRIRKISLQSLSMLTRIGSPIADLKKAANASTEDFSVPDIAEFIFIHAADPETVRRCVYTARFELAPKADEFCAAIPPDKIPEILAAITGDAQAIRAAQTSAIPDTSIPPSKNEPSPAA
ncbi:MAG: hypothetical protein E7037_04305 [Verrucomicrobia bacterium]|nr:hypothetical protein [Verrucomicrobiota bacterium]